MSPQHPDPPAHHAGQAAGDSTAAVGSNDSLDLSDEGSVMEDVPSPNGSDKSSNSGSPDKTEGGTVVGGDGPSMPVQKRRRVTRACDECRRKKIKCDGKQPCTHCSVYSYGTIFKPLRGERQAKQ